MQRVRDANVQQTATAAPGAAQDNTALLDNVSEESVELELPPPMVELQALPTASAVTVEDEMDESNKPEAEGTNGGPPHLSSRSLSTLNISTMGGGELQVCIYKCCNSALPTVLKCILLLLIFPCQLNISRLRLTRLTE